MGKSTLGRQGSKQTPVLPLPKRAYFSAAMLERKKRLLAVTRTMIGESGIENFTIRDVCRRARVAQGTLYTTFHGKDRLIAFAIREAYDNIDNNIRYQTAPVTLEGIMDRLLMASHRNMESRNYTRAITSLYFSHKTGNEVLATLRDMVSFDLRQWLDHVEQRGELAPWVEPDALTRHFANTAYGIIHDWARLWIPDETFPQRLVIASLSIIVGATTGDARAVGRKMLERITRTGEMPYFQPTPLPDSKRIVSDHPKSL